MNTIANNIKQRMSLREPLGKALDVVVKLTEVLSLKKPTQEENEALVKEELIYMIETKAENDINNEDVQEKKKSAMEYCSIVSKDTSKPWQYILIPHNAISRTMQFDYVISNITTL